MPFNRPPLQALIDRAVSDIATRLPGADALVRRSNLYVLSRVHSGAMHELYGELDWLSRQVLPDQCDDSVLLRWAQVFLPVPQKAASFAQGQVTFPGTNGSIIAATTLIQRSDGTAYTVDADTAVVAGVATVNVTAMVAGVAGNAAAATQLSLVSPIAGVNAAGTVAAAGLGNGFDIEAVASVRARLLTRLRQAPQAGTANDYVNWALEVAGVTRAWCFSGAAGSRTIGLCFVTDGAATGMIPTAASVAAVQAYIDSVRPVTAAVLVFAPITDLLNFQIQLTPNTAAAQASVQAELADLISREAIPGGTLLWSHQNQAISVAAGETDHVLVAPATNLVSATGHIATMGAITWL